MFECSVSFRSVPKILECFSPYLNIGGPIRIPHFTTVLRWTIRVGYYLLKRPNRRVCSEKKSWICVIDHTFQVGTNKAIAVLGISTKTMKLGRALVLKDAAVLSVIVKERWTGNCVKDVLGKTFKQNGNPAQIVIDGASDLSKGVREILKETQSETPVTYDITHLMAKLLKRKYEGGMNFVSLISKLSKTSKCIAQSKIGYLLPPKLREKSRFLNLPNLGRWLETIIHILKSKALNREDKQLIKKYFGWIWKPKSESYIKQFHKEIKIIRDVQKILKNTGITEFTYKKACSKLSEIDDEEFTGPIINALSTELDHSKRLGFPMLLTSDLIESLFGKYKSIAMPHKLKEINKMVLTIPCICEEIQPKLIHQVFTRTKNRDVDKWIKRNIPETLLSKRKKVISGIRKEKHIAQINAKQATNSNKTKIRQKSEGIATC